MSREPLNRSLPTFITLIVVGVLLMTMSVRLEDGGVVGVLRSGTQAIVAPLQTAASYVVDPVADLADSFANLASIREENAALRAELAETQAEVVAVQDQLARLELFEDLYELDVVEPDLGRTVADVIGRPDAFDQALIIDKGTLDGVVAGQPVIDTNGFVVGTVKSATPGSATVLPITAGREAVTVLVGSQVGTLISQIGRSEMRFDIFADAREPILAGERVVTSAVSADYPAGLPVGEIIADATPVGGSLTANVRPFIEPERLRLVIVVAWPPDPLTAATDDTLPVEDDTTTTTTIAETTTTEGGG